MTPRCFFADHPDAGPCSGRMTRMHLVPRQLLRREFKRGAVLYDGRWRPRGAGHPRGHGRYRSIRALIDDTRSWAWACWGHHCALDQARTLRIPRDDLPATFLAFAAELGLMWWVDKHYGEPRSARVGRA